MLRVIILSGNGFAMTAAKAVCVVFQLAVSNEMVDECDLLLLNGNSFIEALLFPQSGRSSRSF